VASATREDRRASLRKVIGPGHGSNGMTGRPRAATFRPVERADPPPWRGRRVFTPRRGKLTGVGAVKSDRTHGRGSATCRRPGRYFRVRVSGEPSGAEPPEARLRHDGCGGLAGKAELRTGIEGASSRVVRNIVLHGGSCSDPGTSTPHETGDRAGTAWREWDRTVSVTALFTWRAKAGDRGR